jgi:hypothetical protein
MGCSKTICRCQRAVVLLWLHQSRGTFIRNKRDFFNGHHEFVEIPEPGVQSLQRTAPKKSAENAGANFYQ